MLYPIFTAAFLLYTYYSQYKFDRSSAQIGFWSFEMGKEIASKGLNTVEEVLEYYKGQHAPQFIELIFNTVINLDDRPDEYIHPKAPLVTLKNTIILGSTVLTDLVLSKIINDGENFYKAANLYWNYFLSQVNEHPLPHPLFTAIESSDSKLARYIIDHGASMDVKDYRDATLFHTAAWHELIDMVEFLIENGADVNAKDRDGRTPLHEAAPFKKSEVFEFLIKNGAEVNAKNDRGDTQLHRAALIASTEMARILIENGADVNIKNTYGETPLHVSVFISATAEIVELLIKNGADVEAKDNNGNTPLMWAARNNNIDLAKVLIAAVADVNAKNRDGDMPLIFAARNKLTDIVKLVDVKQLISEASSTSEISFGANLDAQQKVAGGGVTTINILNKGPKASPANFNMRANDILYPNAANNLTVGEGIKLTSYTSSSDTKVEKIIEYGGFAQSYTFNSTSNELAGAAGTVLKFQVNDRTSDDITRGSGATNQVILENIAQQINEKSTGDYSVRARVVTQYVGGVLKSTLLVAPDKANYSLTFLGDATLRNTIGFEDAKNIKQFQISSSSDVIGRFASLQDLKEHFGTAGLSANIFSTDSVGANITIQSTNPLFLENYNKGSGSNFLEEFGLKQGFLATNYDPYDPNNNMAGRSIEAHFSQDVEIYDRMGNKHVMILAFLKLDTNTWAVEAYANDPSKVSVAGRTDGLLQAGILKFDGRGNLQSMLNTTQLAKTKNISSPHQALGATKGQLLEVDVSAGSTSIKHTFTYGENIASSSYFSPAAIELPGTSGDQLNITYKTSAIDPGTTYNVTRGTGLTNIDVLKNLANQINTTVGLRDVVRADVVYDKDGTNKYKIDIRPIDSTKIVTFAETPVAGFGTDLGITIPDNIASNSFTSLYELAEQINNTEGPFALQAEVITGTMDNTYRLKIQPKNPSLNMTFNGDSQVIGAPIGTSVSTTIYEALGFKNTSESNQLASLEDEFVVNWSAIVGADINAMDSDGDTPLKYSIKYDDINMTKLLIKNGANIDLKPHDLNKLLHSSIRILDIELTKLALKIGADINAKSEDSISPLSLVIRMEEQNEVDLVKYLLQNCAEPNDADLLGQSLLHIAAARTNLEVIDLLFKYAANPYSKDHAGNIPAQYAANQEVAEFIAKKTEEYDLKVELHLPFEPCEPHFEI